jgi:hypothetical protein
MRSPTTEATNGAVRHALAILGRDSDTWHNADPAESGPLHWPVAVTLARRQLEFALGISEPQTNEATQDARAGIAWWNHLTPTQRSYWLTRAKSPVPADAWEAFRDGQLPRR